MQEVTKIDMKTMRRYIMYMVLTGTLCSCAGKQPVREREVEQHHMAEIRKPDAVLYVDEVKNDLIMQKASNEPDKTGFLSYCVGIREHGLPDEKQKTARQKYFEYDMQYDWKLVLHGDSIAPVFFHTLVRLDQSTREGMMVFEVPEGSIPEALVYDDSSGDWGRQLILLNTH